MRNVARLKMGYYPLPEAAGVKLRSLLSFPEPSSVLDPCVGQGTALYLVTNDAEVRRYGVELDAERARIPHHPDQKQAVIDDVERIRNHPLVPASIPVYGYVYDVKSGKLIEIEEATRIGAAS